MADCFYGATAHVFPDLLADFGCTVTVLRGQIKVFSSERELKDETRKAIDNVVKMARANREIGVIIGPHGEYIIVIDESGNILTDDDISALLCVYYLKYKNEKNINVPVTSSGVIDRIASPYGAVVRRTSTRQRTIQDVADIFLSEKSGRYPYLEREYDPMIVFLRLLEFASLEGKDLHELVGGIPKSNLYQTSVPCTFGEKALIMRALSSKTIGDGTVIEMIEGIRIIREAAWILVLPDAVHPLIHLYAEGASTEQRDLLIEEFVQFIKSRKAGP
jgi:mannose-1-phosphate guanylyltransferase/phosphomannomutase